MCIGISLRFQIKQRECQLLEVLPTNRDLLNSICSEVLNRFDIVISEVIFVSRHSSLLVRTLIACENSVRSFASPTQVAFEERCNVSEGACNIVLSALIREMPNPFRYLIVSYTD